jgi:hypothetical protein
MNIINPNDLVFTLTYQSNPKNHFIKSNRIPQKYDYFAELKRCIASIRYWYPNAEIYVHSDIEIEIDANVIVKPFENKFNDSYGFTNIYESGILFQNIQKPKLHIDLDMMLVRPLPTFEFEFNTLLGIYNQKDFKCQRNPKFGSKLAETDFILTTQQSTFYTDYLEAYPKVIKLLKNEDPYDYEEFVADFLISKGSISTISNYEIGTGFQETDFIPYFFHSHIPLPQ